MQILAAPFAGIAGDYQSIATVTVGVAGQATVTFSSIPQTFKHLQIHAFARTNRANNDDQIKVQMNADTGSNYTRHTIYGDGGSVSVIGQSAGTPKGIIATGAASVSNLFGSAVLDILDYANTNKYKTMRCLTGVDWNGGGYMLFESSLWLSTAAVTDIVLTPSNGTSISQYSSFALYGIKG
jgi:hypothetical protein